MKGAIVSTTKRLRQAAAVNAPLSSKRTMTTATAAAITTTAEAATAFVSIEKIIARVFCPPRDLTLSMPAAADIDPSSKNTNDADGVGGNPVTVFIVVVPSSPRHSDNTSMTMIPKSIQRRLARTCQWESVIVTITKPNNNHDNNNASSSSTSILPPPTMNFFMPSAEEVSFCAHAAIGGAAATIGVVNDTNTLRSKTITLKNNKNNSTMQFQAAMTGESFVVDIILHDDNNDNNNNATNTKKKENKNCGTTCRLSMTNVRYQEQDLSLDGKRMLQEWCTKLDWSLSSSLLLSSASALKNQQKPFRSRRSCCRPRNASVARIKTLVPLRSVDAVHRAIPPPLPDIVCTTTIDNNSPYYSLSATRTKPNNTNNNNKNNNNFSDACDSMDGSSGIYVYAPIYTDDDDAPSSSAITTCRSIKSSNNNANNVVTSSYECRQFPRSSGYQEDPATGIGAAALAASLHFENDDDTTTTTNNNNNSDASHHHNLYTTSFTGITSSTGSNNSNNNISSSGSDKTIVYNIHQGTTMGRPSLIQVVDLRKDDTTADNDTDGKNSNNNKSDISTSNSTDDTKDFRISFGLQGTVEIDDHCTIEVAIPRR